MSFWMSLEEYKPADNGGTFINVPGVPGEHPRAFCEPLQDALTRSGGTITQDVIDIVLRCSGLLNEADFPGAHAVTRWVVSNAGKRVKQERGRYVSY